MTVCTQCPEEAVSVASLCKTCEMCCWQNRQLQKAIDEGRSGSYKMAIRETIQQHIERYHPASYGRYLGRIGYQPPLDYELEQRRKHG
tara:strand:+ start:104 stop:367 length:264 start_codon:yes stop_codon:yes gene_type:complete